MTIAMPETQQDTMTRSRVAVDTYPEVKPETRTPELSHIVRPPENKHIWEVGMTTPQMVEWAVLKGTYLVALCGHKWYPSKNPKAADHPVCDACVDKAKLITQSGGKL